MAGGMEAHVNVADADRLAIGRRLPRRAELLPVAQRHHGERLRCGEHLAMAAARMIGMGVRDQRAGNRAHGINVEIPRGAIKAEGRGREQMRRHGPQHRLARGDAKRALAHGAGFGQKRAMRSSGDILADRRYAWAIAAAKEGDHAAARDLLEQTLERAPNWPAALLALGDSLHALGAAQEATQAWARAAVGDPSGVLGAQLRLAAHGGAPAPERAPDDYVRELFDEYADRFDSHLVGALAYRGPEILRAALERARGGAGAPLRFARAMDLGCGTGLMALALKDAAQEMCGVDLSPRMAEAARRTGLYARVQAGDVTQALAAEPAGAFDLVIAADVFVYMGDLAQTFAQAARTLRAGGLFAFTVQKGAQDWALGPDLRYAHSPDYLRRMAQAAGLEPLVLEEASTRKDAGADVPGLVAVFLRP